MSDITFKVENFNQTTGNYVIDDINNIDKTFFKLLLTKGVTSITVDSGQIISNKRVHDGDTIMLGPKGNGISVRFMHSDTPEEKQTTFDGRQIGIEARNKLINEVKNTTKLTISFDPKRPLDVYDRILGEVHPGADSSSESLNKKMVKSGYAQYYNFEDSDPANVKAEWESYAKEGITTGVGKDIAYNPKATTPREYRHIVSDTYKAFLIKKLEQANVPVSEKDRKLAFYELDSLEKKVKTAYPNIRLDVAKNKIIQDIIMKGESEQLKYFTPEEIQKYQEENAKKLSDAGYKTDKLDKQSKYPKKDDDEDKTPDSILKESVETIIINGLELPLLPTDMTSFRDNAILEEVYIRAHGAFAFRSKFSRTEIQFTLAIPIPENTTSYKVSGQEKDMWEKGLQIVASLDAYPFSFIKSNRIKSYLGTNTAPSSGDLMMFGNKKITITQDYRLSNMMLVDIVLLYCNHNALVKDFSLKKDFSLEVETTDLGDVVAEDGTVLKVNKDIKKTVTAVGTGSTNALIGFTDTLRGENIGKVKGFIEAHNKGYSNFDNDNKLPHVHIKVPHFIDLGGIVEDVDGKPLHSEIASIPKDLPKEDRIEIKLPRPFDRGEVMLNNDNFVSSQEEIPDPVSAITEPAVASMDLYNVVWLEDTVAYNNSVNPIHSIVLTKERSFASHFVGAYQHPYLQYMGRFPARLTINSAFVSSNYDESTALPYLFNIMLGVIDSNATLHPNANAYNYVKVETLPGLLLDTTHFIPNQSQITAKSDSSNMELFSCSFVENSMDKMIENCKVRIGKAIVNPEVSVNSAKLITAYLTNLEAWLGAGNTYKSEEEENYHSQIIDGLAAIVKDIKGEMAGILSGQPSESTQEQASNSSAGPEKDKSEEYAEAWLSSKLSTTSIKLADITKNTAARDKFIKDWYLPVCAGATGIKGVKIGNAKEVETYCTLPMQKVLANGGKAVAIAAPQETTETAPPAPTPSTGENGNPSGSASWSKLPEYTPSEYTGTSDLTKAKEIIPLLEYRAKMNKARSKTEGGMSEVDLTNSEKYSFNIFVENKIKGIGLLIDHAYILNYPSMAWVKRGKASKEDFENSSRLNDNWLNSFLGHSYPDLGFEKLVQQDSFRRDRALQNINPTFFLDTQKLLSKDEYDIAMQIVDLTNSVDITGEVTTNLEIDESKDQEEDGHYTVRGTVTREGDQKASRPLRESRYMQVEGQATVDSVYGDDGIQRPGDSSTYGNSVLGGGAFSPESEKLFGKLELSAGLNPQIGLGKDAEIRAALDLISRAEGTHEAKGGKGYAQTVYGQSIIGYPGAKSAFPDWRVGQPHPGAHGRGERGSAYVGKNRVGQDIYSDATGRYQYMYDTWANMSGGNLGMDAKTQDDRALTLMGSAAIQKLKNKDWLGFCKDNRIGSQWASFPTNNYHQGAKTAEQLASALASLYDFYSGSGSNTSDIAKAAIAQGKPSSAVVSSVTKVKAGVQTLDFKLWKPTINKKTGKPFEKNESTWVSSTYTLGVLSVQDGKTFLANDVENPNDIYKITVDGIIVPEPQTRALNPVRRASPGSYYSVDRPDRNGEMYGTQSAEALKSKIEGYRVKVTVGFGDAVVKLGDGFKYDLAEWLVYSGNARVDPSKKSKFPKLVQLEADAKKAGRGVWQYPQALSGEKFNPITNLTVKDPILKGKAPDKTGTVEKRKWYEINRNVDVTATEVAAATEATGVAITIDPKIQKAVGVAKAQAGVITKRAIANGRMGPIGRKYVGTIRLCSAYVADALYQGGLGDVFASSPGGQWNHTKNFLKSNGFTRIPIDSTWVIGDLVVMQVPNSPSAIGHIAIFTGSGGGTTGWISDFVQKHPGVYRSRGDSPAVLYRCNSMLGNVKPYSGNNTWDRLSQMKSQGAMTTSGYYNPGVDPANVTSYQSKERLESLSLKQIQGFEIKDVDFEDVPNASVYSRDLRISKFGDKMIKSFKYGLDTCFPVVKAYLVIGNEDDDFFIDMVPLFSSAYYELPPLQSFNLDTNNDMNPLDIATFSIINPSAMRSMLSEYIETSFGNMDMNNVNNQYFHRGITDKLALKAGLRVHIRAGYSNDPNQLTPIFNGVIRETSGLKDRVIECVAESYSSELLDSYMGPAKAISLSGRHHASTGLVLAYALLMDNINHFGAQIGRFQLAKAWMGSFVGAPVDLWQSFFQSAFGISNKAVLAGIGIASGAILGASIGSLFGPVGTLVGGAAGGIWAGFSILKSPATDENGLTYNTQEQTMSDNIFGGKGRRGDFRDPENKALVAPVSAGNFLWNAFNVSRGNLSQRLFVNIFSDSIEEIHGMFKDEWWNRWKQLLSFDVKVFYRFFVYKSTAWTIIKEMEYRHPGTLAKPLVYEDRQSMFFGVKEQLYVARDLDPVFMNKCGFASRFKERYTPFTEIYLAERHKRLEPATGFHIINSRVNLLSNNLSLNRDFATKITAQYFETQWEAGEEKTEPFTETVLLDRTLAKFDIKEKVISLGGCHGNYLALLYAIQELKKEMEKMYGGKILITGNPEMRAGDYAYIEDTDRNLAGVIKIRECQHHFSPTDGYVTEITPGLYVEATHFMWDDLFTQLNMASRLLSTKLSMEQTSNNIGNQVRDNYFEMLKIMQEIKDPSAGDYAYMFGGYLLVAGVGYLSARTLLKRLGGTSKIGSYRKFLLSIAQSSKNVGVPAIRTMVKSLRDKGIKIAEQIDDDATRAASQKGEKALAEYEKNKKASSSMMQKAKNKLNSARASLGFAGKNAHTVKMPGMRQIIADRNWALMKKLGVKRVLARSVKGAVMASVRTGWRFMSPKGALKGGPLMILGLLLAWNYGLSVTRKLELTTNPITFFPLMYGDDPYTAGISGFSNKGLIDAAYENLVKNASKIKMHAGIADASGGNSGFNYAHIAGLTMKLFAQTEETAGGALLTMMGANTDIKGDNKSKRVVDAKAPKSTNTTPPQKGNAVYRDAIESDDSAPDPDA